MKRIFTAKIKHFKGVKANRGACDTYMIPFITKTRNKWYNLYIKDTKNNKKQTNIQHLS